MRHRPGSSRQWFALLALVLMHAWALPALAGPAAGWRFCYAGSERDRRFYVSQPFPTAQPLEAIERQWTVWLGRQALRYETAGCPRGADPSEVDASVRSAIHYNAGQGRNAVELDWKPVP